MQITAAQYSTIVEDVLKRAVAGLAQDGKPFVGCLYAGIMVTKEGIKCLEFNCRYTILNIFELFPIHFLLVKPAHAGPNK